MGRGESVCSNTDIIILLVVDCGFIPFFPKSLGLDSLTHIISHSSLPRQTPCEIFKQGVSHRETGFSFFLSRAACSATNQVRGVVPATAKAGRGKIFYVSP